MYSLSQQTLTLPYRWRKGLLAVPYPPVTIVWFWSGTVAYAAAVGIHPWGPAWLAWTGFASLVVGPAALALFESSYSGDWKDIFTDPENFVGLGLGPLLLATMDREDLLESLLLVLVIPFSPAMVLYFYVSLRAVMVLPYAFLTILLVLVIVGMLIWRGLVRDRAARNPLHGLLPK